MKVFISWSGDLSKELAETFRQWLPGVIQAVQPYFTPDDVEKGARWSTEISRELEESMIGIICLTRDNLDANWIMFEAGALTKNLGQSKVCPILFGLEPTDVKGPLVQFQSVRFEKSDIRKLIRTINNELGENALDSNVLDSVFDMWWPKLEEKVDKIIKNSKEKTEKSIRTDRELLEEILSLQRSGTRVVVDQAIESRVSTAAIRDLMLRYSNLVETLYAHGEIGMYINDLNSLVRPIAFISRRVDIDDDEVRNRLSAARRMIREYTIESDKRVSEAEKDLEGE